MEALIRFDVSYLVQTSGPVLWPMFIGSLPTVVVVWAIFYFPLQPMISRYQSARHHRRTRRQRERISNTDEQRRAEEILVEKVTHDGILDSEYDGQTNQ